MTIMPKRGYRVCLKCGAIFTTKMFVEVHKGNKTIKCCPKCFCGEKEKTDKEVLNDVNAVDLFNIVSLKAKEFYLTPELEQKYEKMYDNCLIPKSVRV